MAALAASWPPPTLYNGMGGCYNGIVLLSKTSCSPLLIEAVSRANFALSRGVDPILSDEGLGGTYFVRDVSGHPLAVFKPADEEPGAPNNPKGNTTAMFKAGISPGEGASRELAAYVIDRCLGGFFQVPETANVLFTSDVFCYNNAQHANKLHSAKAGSLQLFVSHEMSCEDVGTAKFTTLAVHRIAVLDLLTFNLDRHAGNILLGQCPADGSCTLTPIDHGYCLPENAEDAFFEWQWWPQSRQSFDPSCVKLIGALQPGEIAACVTQHVKGISPSCLLLLQCMALLLKECVLAGMTPQQVASMCARSSVHDISQLQLLLKGAERCVFMDTNINNGQLSQAATQLYLQHFSLLLRLRLQKLQLFRPPGAHLALRKSHLPKVPSGEDEPEASSLNILSWRKDIRMSHAGVQNSDRPSLRRIASIQTELARSSTPAKATLPRCQSHNNMGSYGLLLAS